MSQLIRPFANCTLSELQNYPLCLPCPLSELQNCGAILFFTFSELQTCPFFLARSMNELQNCREFRPRLCVMLAVARLLVCFRRCFWLLVVAWLLVGLVVGSVG